MSVHYHFVIACFFCGVLFVVFHRKSSNVRQLFGLVVIPILSYFFTYKISLLPSWDGFDVYVISIICTIVTLFLSTLAFEEDYPKKEKKKMTIVFAVLTFFLLAFIYGIPWLIKAFPLDNPDAVLFTLLQNKAGTEGFVWGMVWKNVLSPTLFVYVPISLALFLLAVVVRHSKKKWCFNFFWIRTCLNSGANIWVPLRQLSTLFLVFSLLVFCVVVPKLFPPLYKLCETYFEPNERCESRLYLNEYVFPDFVGVEFPERKKNLIYIMMESMEVNFKDYTPELDSISQNNVSFLPGGVDVAMTGWTIAAQVSKNCGIPLNVPYGLENSDEILSFLPNATCMTDILAKNSYKQIYVQCSDGAFASTRAFWSQHGVKEFHDFSYYKKNNKIDKKESIWGCSDKTLYRLMQEELSNIDNKEPFALHAITIDSHFPEGYISEGCFVSETESSRYPSALRCASKQLNAFLKWAKNQDWYENTTIVVVGDHSWITFTDLLKLPKDEPLYWINFFINSQIQPLEQNRTFSSFDMFPTVLEAMGVNVPGHRLGLGTSLFSAEKTLLEKMHIDTLNAEIREKSYQYDYFMNGGSFKRE